MANNYQILALHGGGYKGLYTAKVLAEIENKTSKHIADMFDMLTGTSIGGIIALALAKKVPAEEIVKLFTEKGSVIFPTPSPEPNKKKTFIWKGRNKPFHDNKPLRKLLVELLGEQSAIKDLNRALLVPTFNHSKGEPSMFKTNHDHMKRWVWDQEALLVDVAMATSAAPLFFPLYCNPESKTHANVYSDGGLVANAPGFVAYLEAINSVKVSPDLVRVLSITTTSNKKTLKSEEVHKYGLPWGIGDWGAQLFETMMTSQEQQADYYLTSLLRDEQYFRVNRELTAEAVEGIRLDNPSKGASKTLLDAANESTKENWQRILPFTEHTPHGLTYADIEGTAHAS